MIKGLSLGISGTELKISRAEQRISEVKPKISRAKPKPAMFATAGKTPTNHLCIIHSNGIEQT